MKTNKALSDLRTFIDDVENKRVDLEEYSYSFGYRRGCTCDSEYEPCECFYTKTGNEKIVIEFSRNDVG